MSTDTAMALAGLSWIAGGTSPRLRQFLITVLVADDVGALVVIAVFYSDSVQLVLVASAAAVLAVYGRAQWSRWPGQLLAGLAVLGWALTRPSGIDPIVAGLAVGLLSPAYTPALAHLEHVSRDVRSFREQPSPTAARVAIAQLRASLSPNARLQHRLSRFVSLVVVPLFVIANLGITVDTTLLQRASTSPITWGVLAGLVVGKPFAFASLTWASRVVSRGALIPPVTGTDVLTAGAISSMGFTVTVLIAGIALDGTSRDDAVTGAVAAVVIAPVLAVAWRSLPRVLPRRLSDPMRRPGAPALPDLAVDVDESRDHVRGHAGAGVTIVEYGDFECPFCGRAESSLTTVLHELPTQVRYVWRHLPLVDVHPAAWRAALASEAAAAQGSFWPMHDALLARRTELGDLDLVELAASLALDADRFIADFQDARTAQKVSGDIESARLSAVAGTPTLFINGVRHEGDYGPAALRAAALMALEPVVDQAERAAETSAR
jgi:Na+/H+ antiporter NhaA/predicted DsbA family dithiol-disulfide isomerase